MRPTPPTRVCIHDAHEVMTRAELDRLVVRIDRGTVWGNPYKVGTAWDENLQRSRYVTRTEAVAKYEELMRQRLRGSPGPFLGRTNPEGRRWSHSVTGSAPTPEDRDAEALMWIDRLKALEGKALACWCRPEELCHGNVLIALFMELPLHTFALREKQANRASKARTRERNGK